MSKEKVTIQDIANALGLSRTTVSKAMNGSGSVPEKTVRAVLQKAKEMNYKQFAYLSAPRQEASENSVKGGNVALLAHIMPSRFHIASTLMATLEQEISRHGFSLTIHILGNDDIHTLSLPQNMRLEQVDAFICLELFDEAYTRMLCSLKKPLLFSDAFFGFPDCPLPADLLLMESRRSTCRMISSVIASAKLRSVGFIGDRLHCLSFQERFEGYRSALADNGIPWNPADCIMEADEYFADPEWLYHKVSDMKKLPDMFFCANDLLALQMLSALTRIGAAVPEDILLCGFDDTLALNSVNSTLTTVRTPSTDMGVIAARMLLNRIASPGLPPVMTYLHTEVQFRRSTEGKKSK